MTGTPLSHRLRAETKEAHTTAERSGIMRELLRGTITVPNYVTLLQNLAALYEALEDEIDRNSQHPALRDIQWDHVRRLPSLQNDIAQIVGQSVSNDSAGHATVAALVPATSAYVQHLRNIGAHTPALLFPHAYLRYLGDMYGGQIIKRIVSEKVLPRENNAVSFYDFDQLDDLHAFMVTFRGSLDTIPLSDNEADTMVREAQLGYEFHARIFNELAAQ